LRYDYDLGVEFPACGLPADLRSDHTNAQGCGRRLANGTDHWPL